ncbi:MAG: M23 family metallopeptidase [Geobacter sp.]|nr:MAG: M23 family metallopeptidase [Geobacter sp.]
MVAYIRLFLPSQAGGEETGSSRCAGIFVSESTAVVKCGGWLVLLCALFSLSGCLSAPGSPKGSWPWEYGGDHAKAQTGNYGYISGAVADFGEAPGKMKAASDETAGAPPSAAPAAPADKVPAAAQLPALAGTKPPGTAPEYDFILKDVEVTPPDYVPTGSVETTHDITAVNNGHAPVSLLFEVDREASENLEVGQDMPLYLVIPPKTWQVVFHGKPSDRRKSSHARYAYAWGIGAQTAEHRCPEGYRLPFGLKVKGEARLFGTNAPYDRYAVRFRIPAGTEVCAARKGTIVRIREKGGIDILHEDATIASYRHLGQLADGVTEGKAVSAREPLGVVHPMGKEKLSYLEFVVWRPQPRLKEDPSSRAPRPVMTSVSFPLEFCNDSGYCFPLTGDLRLPISEPARSRSKTRRLAGDQR